jgi:hypothetical protein
MHQVRSSRLIPGRRDQCGNSTDAETPHPADCDRPGSTKRPRRKTEEKSCLALKASITENPETLCWTLKIEAISSALDLP